MPSLLEILRKEKKSHEQKIDSQMKRRQRRQRRRRERRQRRHDFEKDVDCRDTRYKEHKYLTSSQRLVNFLKQGGINVVNVVNVVAVKVTSSSD